LVNLENFNHVKVQSDGTVVVGTGAYFSDLINAVGAAGRELSMSLQLTLSHAYANKNAAVGSCPCVGSTGAMLGGGLGRLQGLHGLTSDALRKVRLALWNGTIIEASESQNQDLFWGIRGSGQNYGIVFESTYETWPATHGGVHYSADMTFPKSSVEKVMKVVNKLTSPALDNKLALITFFSLNATTSEVSKTTDLLHSQYLADHCSSPWLSTSCILDLRKWDRSIPSSFRLIA
jgi:FAD/FMN-containing dehydrogenase